MTRGKGSHLYNSLKFLQALVGHSDNECVPWPFKARMAFGYGAIRFEGQTVGAHRVVCILAHGRAPGLHAAHSCGNSGCVNPNHIRWATPAENCADKKLHGTQICGDRHPFSKLTDEDVRLVRQMAADGMMHTEIAKMFGVSNSTISGIVKGRHRRETAIMAVANVGAG